MIQISTLPLIINQGQLHSASQILLVDILNIGDAPRKMREYIKANHGGFVFEKETYMPITLTGNPESLIANAEKGILFKFDHGFQNLYILEANPDAAIWHKKLYNLSAYAEQQQISFVPEVDFIIERYIVNRREFPIAEETILKIPASLPKIGAKSMQGLKPVRH
ncbi:MAG TPA: hypothetical protein VGN64_19955 [Dyadobacter sp.]|jgi:hypothetical protein|nr:hypothetical protein [Dyadobacter sp.]